MKHIMRRAAIAALGITVIADGVLAASPAQADHGIATIGAVNVRTGPGTEYPVVAVMPAGVSPTYSCYAIGETIGGVRVWFEVVYEGKAGFITSFYDDSSYGSPGEIPAKYGIPTCGEVATEAAPVENFNTVETDCSGNDYVSAVEIQDYTEGQFDILVYPTSNARYAQWSGYGQEATWEIWAAVQACVPGLYDELADGIYQQIECHVLGGLSGPFEAGGETYGLESWRRKTSWTEVVTSRCNWGGFPHSPVGDPYRTDGAYNNPTF